MPSILSSCLILLKLAMAVNDGLHTMLSNVCSVIENALQNDQGQQSVPESSSAPEYHRSKSQKLGAFNRRRANLVIYDQTDVLVSNLTPFQEITITNKDVEGKRRQAVSPIKKSSCKRTINRCKRDVESNEETPFPEKSSHSNSQSRSSSPVSSEITYDSEDQSSCRVDYCSLVGETKNDLCEEYSMDEPMETLEDAALIQNDFLTSSDISASSTSRASRSNKSPITESKFLKYLQENIPLTSRHMFKASNNSSNKQPPKNVWGLKESDSTDNGQNVKRVIQSNSAKNSPGDAVSEDFSAIITKLCEDFLQDYSLGIYASTCLKTKRSDTNSNGNLITFEDNFAPLGMTSNSPARATNSDGPLMTVLSFEQKTKPFSSIECRNNTSDQTDSDCTEGFGYFSEDEPVTKVSATNHINISEVPLLLKKDRWINMDELNDLRCLHKLDETSSKNEESNLEAHSKECSNDSNNNMEEFLSPLSNTFGTGKDAFKMSNDCQYSMKPNSSYRLVCEELDDSYDLEVIGRSRIDHLNKVLKEVGSSVVLGKPEHFKEDVSNLLKDILDSIRNTGFSSAVKTNSATASNKKIPNFDNIPFTDLDTEEKQVNYLNNVTDSCLKEIKKESEPKWWEDNLSMDDEPFEDLERRHKVMLETVAKVCENDFGFITLSTDMHKNRLPLTDTGLKMKFDIPFIEREATSNGDRDNICVSSQPSSKVELDTFGLPFVQNESEVKDAEHVPNNNASFEMHSGAVSKDDLSDSCDGDKGHSESSFSNYCRNNETSTPISDEMLDKQNWDSINLSVESRKEFDAVVSDDDKSRLSCNKRQNLTVNEKDAIPSLIGIGMEDVVHSPNASDVKEGNTLEAKDWGKLASEISINYKKCIDMCGDEAEDANTKAKSNSSADVCKGISDAQKTELLCEIKDLVRSNSCNDALPLESNETTNSEYNSGLEYEEPSSCKDKELDDLSSLDSSSDSDSSVNNSSSSHNELNFGDSVIEKCYLDSEKSDMPEVEIADHTQLEMLLKLENASCSKEVSPNLSSNAVIVEQLLSSTHTVFVKRTSNEMPTKPNLDNKDFLNKEFLASHFDMEVESYLKCVESENEKSRKVSIDPADHHLNYEFNLEDQKINCCPISKQFMGVTRSYPSKSTPMSNIEALQRREEMETTRIYDNEETCDDETLIDTHSDCDLPPSDNQNDFKYETDVSMLKNGNENGTLIEINNAQKAGNDLIIYVEGTKVIDVNCENSIEKDLECGILN